MKNVKKESKINEGRKVEKKKEEVKREKKNEKRK